MSKNLSDFQIYSLAKPLLEIVIEFFENEKNEEEFQKWLISRNLTDIK